MKFLSQLLNLFCRRKLDAEMTEEMRLHIELQTERNRASGMNPDEARYAALREFGNVGVIQQQVREGRGWVWLEQLGQDLGYAGRQLRRSPGFTLTVVAVLGLGIGVNTAIFNVVDALLFRPLPIKDPAGLLALRFVNREGRQTGINVSAPFSEAYRQDARSFSEFIAHAPILVPLRTDTTEPEQTTGQLVSGNYFSALGIKPSLGRLLTAEDDARPGQGLVAVLSHDCWQRLFAGDENVIGQVIVANKQALTVVGVAPRGFHGLNGLRRAQFWAPSSVEREVGAHTTYDLAGWLAPGISRESAIAELDGITRGLAEAYGRRSPPGYERYGVIPPGMRPTLVPAAMGVLGAQSGMRDNIGRVSMVFGGAVGFVLLAACANVANLLLLRAIARRREIAVRLTLGATRGRLLRQLLAESLLLALIGAALGLLLAFWGAEGLMALRAGMLAQITIDSAFNVRVLAFTAGLAVLTGLVFGLLPVRQALRFELAATLQQETPAASVRHQRFALRNLLVVAQVVAGMVLLLMASLCLRSFVKLITLDPGFDTRNVLTATFSLEREKYPPATARVLVGEMLDRLAAAPGVREVSLTNHMVPLSGNTMGRGVDRVEDYVPKPGERLQFGVAAAGPGYFRLLGIPLVMGREFDAGDAHGRPEVAVVNESFARHYWPGQNPLGKHIDRAEVIGVVADSRSEQLWLAPEPQMYPAILQGDVGVFTLLVKTEADPGLFAPVLRRELAALDQSLRPVRIETLQGIWSDSLAGHRTILVLLAIFAGLVLVLAAVGLYGVVAFAVSQRTREIGIRMAVGAERREIVAMVVRQGMALAGVGLVIGAALALLVAQGLSRMLHEVRPHDFTAMAGSTLMLGLVALGACWLPARRAAKVNPMVALRAE